MPMFRPAIARTPFQLLTRYTGSRHVPYRLFNTKKPNASTAPSKPKDKNAPKKGKDKEPKSDKGPDSVDAVMPIRTKNGIQAPESPWISGESSDSRLVSPTAEDLLKQRFLHAQKKSPGNTLMTGGSGSATDMPSFFRTSASSATSSSTKETDEKKSDSSKSADASSSSSTSFMEPDETSLMNMSSSSETQSPPKKEEKEPLSKQSAFSDTTVVPFPAFQSAALTPSQRSRAYTIPDQPFDSHVFVRRLLDGGWQRSTPATPNTASSRRHDPAEALMDLTRELLKKRGEALADEHINRGDLDNQLYLFSSALAELRTEVRVRARNDGAALRSLTSLLEREIDGLSQKLQADIEQLKHDIQVDMNNRKTEVQEENNKLELEIQDLNTRFTLFLSDLKTEIEQSIKWDATRRALALVFGITAILVCTLAMADYFSRQEAAASDDTASRGTGSGKSSPARTASRAPIPIDHTLHDQPDELPPKSAEEWGLLPRYESDEARYV